MSQEFTDFFWEENDDGVYDLVVEDGTFKTVQSFDTSLQMVIHCERRAESSEVSTPQYRRGFWANQFLFDDGFELGSKLWLFNQERRTDVVLNKIIDAVRTACRWYVEDGHVKDYEVTGSFRGIDGVYIQVDFILFNNKVESRYYELWKNTGHRDTIEYTTAQINLLLEDGSELVTESDEGLLLDV